MTGKESKFSLMNNCDIYILILTIVERIHVFHKNLKNTLKIIFYGDFDSKLTSSESVSLEESSKKHDNQKHIRKHEFKFV